MNDLYAGFVSNAPQRPASQMRNQSLPTLKLLQHNIADINTEDGLMVIAILNVRTGETQDSLSSEDFYRYMHLVNLFCA